MIVTAWLDNVLNNCEDWHKHVDMVVYVGDDPSVRPSEYGFELGYGSLKLSERLANVISNALPEYQCGTKVVSSGDDEYEVAEYDDQALFDEVIKPLYKGQLERNKQAMSCLSKLIELDKAGKRIAIASDASDKKTDIRTVLARMLRNMGANVVWH